MMTAIWEYEICFFSYKQSVLWSETGWSHYVSLGGLGHFSLFLCDVPCAHKKCAFHSMLKQKKNGIFSLGKSSTIFDINLMIASSGV